MILNGHKDKITVLLGGAYCHAFSPCQWQGAKPYALH